MPRTQSLARSLLFSLLVTLARRYCQCEFCADDREGAYQSGLLSLKAHFFG